MFNVNDYLAQAETRIRQFKNQKVAKERREQQTRQKANTRLYITIGKLVCKYFPDMMEYKPQYGKADTSREFMVFENVLRILAANAGMMSRINEMAVKRADDN